MLAGSLALCLISLSLANAGTAARQEQKTKNLPDAPSTESGKMTGSTGGQGKPKDLPDAPAPKAESVHRKRENPVHATIEILGRRSIFFPELAASSGSLKPRQKLELFVDESIAPSRFLSSAIGAGIGQAHDSLSGYGQGMSGYGKRFGSSLATASSNNFLGHFCCRPCCTGIRASL